MDYFGSLLTTFEANIVFETARALGKNVPNHKLKPSKQVTLMIDFEGIHYIFISRCGCQLV